jgi:hypothetical protein
MDYGMIGKIEKAKRYAQERERITFDTLEIQFKGDNSAYTLTLDASSWHCSCPGYQKYTICPHVMAVERLLKPMLKRPPQPYAPGQNVVSDVEKAKRYAEETDRIRIHSFAVTFKGNNGDHHTRFSQGVWDCDCDFFKSRNVCSHTMAMERILKGMVVAAPAVVD